MKCARVVISRLTDSQSSNTLLKFWVSDRLSPVLSSGLYPQKIEFVATYNPARSEAKYENNDFIFLLLWVATNSVFMA